MRKEWKTFGYFRQYRVSNYGIIETKSAYNMHTGNFLKKSWRELVLSKASTDRHVGAYLQTSLNIKGDGSKTVRVHRLVAEKFIGPCVKGMQVNHIDGDRFNNRLDNLEYTTPKENIQNARDRGAFIGKGRYKGKLSLLDFRWMESLLNDGFSNTEIAKIFSVDRSTVSHFKRGRYFYKPILKEAS